MRKSLSFERFHIDNWAFLQKNLKNLHNLLLYGNLLEKAKKKPFILRAKTEKNPREFIEKSNKNPKFACFTAKRPKKRCFS